MNRILVLEERRNCTKHTSGFLGNYAVTVTNPLLFGTVSPSTTAQARGYWASRAFSSQAPRLREYRQFACHAIGCTIAFQKARPIAVGC